MVNMGTLRKGDEKLSHMESTTRSLISQNTAMGPNLNEKKSKLKRIMERLKQKREAGILSEESSQDEDLLDKDEEQIMNEKLKEI